MKDWTELQLNRPLEEGTAVVGTAPDGKKYAVCKVEQQVYVCENRCRHQGGPLGNGCLSDHTLICAWHGWEYDISDGSCISAPEERPLEVYESRLVDGSVLIRGAD